jgi:hypothetical protein
MSYGRRTYFYDSFINQSPFLYSRVRRGSEDSASKLAHFRSSLLGRSRTGSRPRSRWYEANYAIKDGAKTVERECAAQFPGKKLLVNGKKKRGTKNTPGHRDREQSRNLFLFLSSPTGIRSARQPISKTPSPHQHRQTLSYRSRIWKHHWEGIGTQRKAWGHQLNLW